MIRPIPARDGTAKMTSSTYKKEKLQTTRSAGWLYDFAFLIFAVISIPKFLVRLNQTENRPQFIKERFGNFSVGLKEKFLGQKVVWIHAVSVGEVMAARPWIRLFLEKYPDWTVAFSTTTPTGQTVARAFASERVAVFYAPFDLSYVVKRVLDCIRPKLILLMETEIWPNLISEASFSGIPIGIINGRISPRSFGRYRWIRSWIGTILKKLSFCLVQSDRDRDYFLKLGMPEPWIAYTGNMKFDQLDAAMETNDPTNLAVSQVARNGLIFIAGSTNWNEEELVLRVFRRLRETFPNLKLILAPRHPERLSKVVSTLKQQHFSYESFSKRHANAPFEVLLVDQMGILASLYLLADIVFIGGSFVRRGGQNPIEAAFCKKPLLHGPNVSNFHEVYRVLDEKGAAFQVFSEEELYQKSKMLLLHPEIRGEMGARAWSSIQSMKGATVRTLNYLAPWLQGQEQSAAVVK